jgi:hypothetical protein
MELQVQDFVRRLFEAFPEFRAHAREQTPATGERALLIEVPAPAEAMTDRGLVIECDDEVTIRFDWYHDHFGADEGIYMDFGEGEEVCLDAALTLVRQLFAERLVVVSYWRDDQWRGSSLMRAGASPDTENLMANLRAVGDTAFNRIRVRSWRGTFSTDIPTALRR